MGLFNEDNLVSENRVSDEKSNTLFDEKLLSETENTFLDPNILLGDINEFDNKQIPIGGFEALRKRRAINQSTGEQLSNTAIRLLPAVGLGLIENAGYLLEVPDALAGDRKDYTNGLVEFAKKHRESLEETFPIFRENPNEVFDLTDNAWWIQHGAGLVESIGEFLVTGAGVGSVLGKGASAVSKGLNLGTRTAQALQGTAQGLTAASLAYTEGAMSGAQIYKETYEDGINRGLTDTDANQLASKAASKTVALNTVINTALNISSVAPLFSKNVGRAAKLKTGRLSGESLPQWKARLKTIADDPINDFKPNTKAVLGREILQEGIEEDVNLFAEGEGRLEGGLTTEEELGGENALDRFISGTLSEEGALNFMLGAVGGAGQTIGTTLLTQGRQQKELDLIEKQRVSHVKELQNTLSQIKDKQIALQKEASREVTNDENRIIRDQNVSDLKDELFDINTIHHFQKGTEDALIGTMEEVGSVDNITDLGEEVQKQIDEVVKEGTQLNQEVAALKQQEQTPELEAEIEQKEGELQELRDLNNDLKAQKIRLSGKTEAMQQGLAVNKNDNQYKDTALGKIEDIKKYQQRYLELQSKYNTSPDKEIADVAVNILNKEINHDRVSKTIDQVNKNLDFNRVITEKDVINQSEDAFVNDHFLLEGKLSALLRVKQGKLSKENSAKIDKEIQETRDKIQELVDNDQGLDDITLESKIEKVTNSSESTDRYSTYQEAITNAENFRDDNLRALDEIKNNPDALVKSVLKEHSKAQKQADKLKADKLNEERKAEREKEQDAKKPTFGTEGITDETSPVTESEVLSGEETSVFDDDVDSVSSDEGIEPTSTTPDSYSEDSDFTNNPSKDVNTKEQEEVGDSEFKIVNAASSIAYRVKSFTVTDGFKSTDSNELEENLPKGVLVENNYKEGDSVVVELDKDYKQTIEGVEINFEDFNNDPLKVPMKIVHKETGEVIGYVHDIDYMNENSVASVDDNIELQKKLVTDFRNKVINNNGSVETKLSSIRGGFVISTNRNKNEEGTFNRPSSSVFSNPDLSFGVIGLEGIQRRGSEVTTRNTSDFLTENSGKVVALLPDVTGKLLGVPLSINKIDDSTTNTMSTAIEFFYKKELNDNEKQVIADIQDKTDLNIRHPKDLQEFLEKYLLTSKINKERSEEILKGRDSRRKYISVSDGVVTIQQEGRSSKSFTKGEPLSGDDMSRLTDHISQMYFNVNDSLIGDKNHISPSLQKDSEGTYTYTQEQGIYNNYIKRVSSTNVHENEVTYKGKTHYSYFDNPVYEIDLGTVVVKKEEVTEEVEIESKPKKSNISDKRKKRKALLDKSLGNEEVIKEDNKKSQSPVTTKNEDFTELDKLREALTTDIDVSFTPEQLNDVINTGFRDVLITMMEDVSKEEALQEWTDFVTEEANGEDEIYSERYSAVLSNIEEINNTISKEIDRITGLLFKEDVEETSEEGIEDKESSSEVAFHDSDAIWAGDNKFKSSDRMKALLLLVVETEVKTTTSNKNGVDNIEYQHLDVQNYLDFNNVLPIDHTFNLLKEILAGVPNDFESMMDALEKESNNIGWLPQVINNFTPSIANGYNIKDIDQLKNEFVKLMSNYSFTFKTALYSRDSEGHITTELIDTDRKASSKRLLESWKDGIKNTKFYDNVEGEYILNPKTVEIATKWYEDNVLNNKNFKELNLLSIANKWLDLFGVDVSNSTLLEIIRSGKTDPSAKFQANKGFFKIFYNNLKSINEGERGFIETNPLLNNSSLFQLAKTDSKNATSVHSGSFRNGEGNTVNPINQNRNITQRLRELKSDPNVAKNLLKVPFLKASNLYQTVLEKFSLGDKTIVEGVNVSVFDTINQRNRNIKGTPLNEQTGRELEASKIISFLDTGDFVKGGTRFFNYSHLVPSKSTAFLVRLPKETVSTVEKGSTILTSSSLNKLYSIALSEIERMNAYQKALEAEGLDSVKIQEYKHDRFYFFNGLNGLEVDGNPIVINGRVELTDSITEAIRNHIQEQFTNMVNDKRATWEKHNIIREGGVDFIPSRFGVTEDINDFVVDYVFNDTLGNYNMHQMFIGDPALFGTKSIDKVWDNISKRLTKDQAPGVDYARDAENTSYVQLALKDVKLDSFNVDNLSDKYKDIETTDAQEFITVKEGLLNLLHSGNITRDTFAKALSQYEVTGKTPDIAGLFQPQKPIYSGKRIHESKDGIVLAEVQDYVKSSAVVLTKDLTQGTELDKVRTIMEKLEKDQGLPVRASFKSANKLGGGEPLNISGRDGNLIDVVPSDKNFVIHERKNLRVQQEVPYDATKDKTVDGTQQRKLIQYLVGTIKSKFLVEGREVSGSELLNEYNDIYEQLYETASIELLEEISDINGDVDVNKVSELLIKEAEDRGWSENSIKGLETKNNRFRMPLFFNTNNNKIESLLNSIVNNKILKSKRRGKSYVLKSEVGQKGYSKGIVYTNEYDPEVGLKPMRVENGVTLPGQIIVPSILKIDGKKVDIRDYAIRDENGVLMLDMNKIPEPILHSFGYRIPTQGYNSMNHAKIVGFLTDDLGDRIIASRDLVAQMGSDFDVDKMYVFFPDYNYDSETNTFSKNTESLDSKLLDLEMAIMSNKDLFGQITQTDDTGGLADLANAKKQDTSLPRIYDSYRTNKYLEAQDGAIGIGVFATLGTFLASTSNLENVYHKYVDKDGNSSKIKVKFADAPGNDISDVKTRDKKTTKLRVNSHFLSASVDNDKDPILGKLNLNKFTFNTIQALVGGGFNEVEIARFVDQQVIRDWVDKYSELIDSSIDEFSEDAELEATAFVMDSLNLDPDIKIKEAHFSDVGKDDKYIKATQLNKFLQLKQLGKDIAIVKSAINTDAKHLPKSILESLSQERRTKDLHSNQNINNASKILGEYDNDTEGVLELIEPSSISGNAVKYGLQLNNNLWKSFYDQYSQELLNTSVKELESITGKSLKDDQKGEIARDLKNYKVGQIAAGILTDSISNERQRLLYGENNLADRLEEAQEKFPEDLFLKSLTIEPDRDGNAPVRIFYNNISTEGLSPDNIQRAFNNRLVDPETSELVEDIIRYSLITNFNNVAGSITNLIPVEYFEIKGISDEMYNTSWNNNEEVSTFVRQFIQNNPKYSRKLPKKLHPSDANINEALDLSENTSFVNEDGYIPYVGFYKEGEGYVLYSHKGKGVYGRIGLLGYKGSKEFDITTGDTDLLSNYIPNNVGVVSPKPQITRNEEPQSNEQQYDDINKDVNKAYISAYDTSNTKTLVDSVNDDLVNSNMEGIYDLLSQYPLDVNLTITVNPGFEGQYNGETNTITLDSTLDKVRFQEVLAHEILHSLLDEVVTTSPSKRTSKQIKLLNAIVGTKGKLNEELQKNTEKYKRFKTKLELFENFKKDTNDDAYLRNRFTEEERDVYLSSVDTKEFIANLFSSDALQNRLNNTKFTGDKSILDRISEIIRKFLDTFRTIGGKKVQSNSELENTISNVVELTRTIELSSDKNIEISQSPVAKPNPTIDQIEALEEQFNLRNGNKRVTFNANDFRNVRKKIVDLNNNKLDSNFRAKEIKTRHGLDKRQNDRLAIEIISNNANKVSYSPKITKETEEDRIVKLIGEFQKSINKLKSKLNTEAKGNKEQQATIRKQIEDLQEKVDALVNQKSIQNIIAFGQDQLKEIITSLDADNISGGELSRIEHQLNLWVQIDNLVLDQDGLSDLESPDVKELKEIKSQADSILTGNWLPRAKNYIFKLSKSKGVGTDSTIDEFYASEKDINLAKREGLGLSRTGLEVLRTRDAEGNKEFYRNSGYIIPLISNQLIDADTSATQEYQNRMKITGEAFKTFKNSSFYKELKREFKNPFEIFAQKDKDGKKTGFTVNRTKDEYFREQERLKSRKDFIFNSPDHTEQQKKKAQKDYVDWRNEHNIQVDVRELFDRETLELNKDKVDSYVKTLAEQLGGDIETATRRANDLIDSQVRKMESYSNKLEGEKLRIDGLEESDAVKETILEEFKLKNDPFLFFDNKGVSQKIGGKFIHSEGYYHISSSPIAKWNDDNFDRINNNEEAREFYKFFTQSMNDLYKIAPDDVFRELQYNHLPYYPKNLMQKINEEGILSASKNMGDIMLDLFREKSLDNIDSKDRDLKTGQVEYDIAFPSRRSVNISDTETEKQINLENQSFDLEKIMNIYTMSVMLYKHKKSIEDDVSLARSLFNQQREVINTNGIVTLDTEGKEQDLPASESLKNKKSQLDYNIDRQLLGVNPDQMIMGQTDKKLTSEDKKIRKALEDQKEQVLKDYDSELITNEVRDIRIDKIDAKILKLGKPVTGRKVLKRLLDYVRAKGMGLNVFAAITNLNIAFIGNKIHAAGGEEFDNKTLMQALSVILNSTGNVIPATLAGGVLGTLVAPGFGTIAGMGLGTLFTPKSNITDTGKKVNSLMNKLEVLGDVTETNVDQDEKKFFDNVGLFELQRKSEYFSQGTTMVAMMKFLTIKNNKGEDVSLWDAYDSDGNWKSDEFSEEVSKEWNVVEGDGQKFLDFKRKLNSTLAKIHGDYAKTTSLKVNSNVVGQAVSMFRRWIPEGIAQRFGDLQGEDDFKNYREGRWKLYTKLDAIKKTFKLLVTFNKGEIDTVGWKDHEIANLKKNVAEIQMFLGVLSLGLMSKMASDEEDDEYAYLSNFALNQIFRLQSDLTFYVSPASFENITRNAVPAFAVFNDVVKTIEYGERILFSDKATDKTTEAFWLRSAKLFPVGSAGVSTYRATEQLFTN